MTHQSLMSLAFGTIVRFLSVVIIGLIPFSHVAAGQSDQQANCQRMTAAFYIAKLYPEFFSRYSNGGFAGPSTYGPGNMVDAAERHVASCGNNGGGTTLCNDLHRQFQKIGTSIDDGAGQYRDMTVNPQTCKIQNRGNPDIDEFDAPEDPLGEAYFNAYYKRQKWFQARCIAQNKGKTFRDGGPPSDYAQKLASPDQNDKNWVASQHIKAWGDALGPINKYLEKYCYLDHLRMRFGGLRTSCDQLAESTITVDYTPQTQASLTERVSGPNSSSSIPESAPISLDSFFIRLGDWGRGRILTDTEPFQLGPEQPTHENNITGECYACCSDESLGNTAYLFGGPDQTIVVGKTNVSLGCEKNDDCGSSTGDPHMCTHDGLAYDFHGVGEFVLAKTEDFEVQARHGAFGKFATINTAAAVRLMGDRVAFYSGDPIRLTVNGGEIEMETGEIVKLAGGAVLRREGDKYRVTTKEYVFEAVVRPERIRSIHVRVPPDSKSGGLLGDRNGDRQDDQRPAKGEPLIRPIAFEDLYNIFGSGWRVTAETSLFDYATGQTPDTFADLTYPLRRTSVKDFSESVLRNAEQVCRKAGVKDPSNLEDCIYDVGLTGDESFAEDAATRPIPRERLEMKFDGPNVTKANTTDGVTIEAPDEAIASYPVKIHVKGSGPQHSLRIAKVGSHSDASIRNPYSTVGLKGGDEMVTLHAPYEPGQYEIRLVSHPGGREVFLKLPFRSVEPTAEIEAEPVAKAGETINVTIFGDISPNSKINIVRVGSPSSTVGAHTFLRGGLVETVTVTRVPTVRGEYEIRYSSSTSEVIYARKKLTIQ